jgi:hypothetical protein
MHNFDFAIKIEESMRQSKINMMLTSQNVYWVECSGTLGRLNTCKKPRTYTKDKSETYTKIGAYHRHRAK